MVAALRIGCGLVSDSTSLIRGRAPTNLSFNQYFWMLPRSPNRSPRLYLLNIILHPEVESETKPQPIRKAATKRNPILLETGEVVPTRQPIDGEMELFGG